MANKPSSTKGGDKIESSRPVFVPIENYAKFLNDRIGILDRKTEQEKFDPKKHKDTKRAHIALVFVYGYMISVIAIVILAPLFNAFYTTSEEPLDLERILAQVGSLIGAPLGFVIGYYFKEDK